MCEGNFVQLNRVFFNQIINCKLLFFFLYIYIDEFIVETVVSSSEIISDDPSTNTRTFSAVVSTSKGTIGLHNAYIAAGTFATAIFIVAIVVSIIEQTILNITAADTHFD